MKNPLVAILIILTCLFLAISVDSCRRTQQHRQLRDKEMSLRLDLEEKMNFLMRDKEILEGKLEKSAKELEEEALAHQSTKNILLDEQLRTQNLMGELENANKQNKIMEQDLQKTLSDVKEVK